jgi:hypothetical protein
MRFRFWIFGKVVLVLVGIAVLSWVLMSLWNWVMPALFIGARTIDFAHAIGVLVLSRLLFGGFRGHGPWGGGPWGRRHWRRWEQMTPEEREKFQQGMASMRHRRGWGCGWGPKGASNDRT